MLAASRPPALGRILAANGNILASSGPRLGRFLAAGPPLSFFTISKKTNT
jgi:hypothetical protein